MGTSDLGKAYQDGDLIIHQGEAGECMFVIQQGGVEVLQVRDGREVVLATLGPGDFFGEMALFEREVRSATVRAKGSARVLTIDKRTLLRRIQEDPSLAFNLLKEMSHRIRRLDRELTQHCTEHH